MNVDTIALSREPAGALLPSPAKPPPRHRILVVEDDSDIRRLNTEALLHSGYHVDAARDGADAWDTLRTNSYDLLVTDNDMPKVTGVDLLKKLHAAHLAVPVIMATGVPPLDEFAQCPWLEPAAVIIKPYTIDELLGKVRQVLHGGDSSGGQAAPGSCPDQPSVEDWRKLLVTLRRNDAVPA
jgi:DNA-binding response OmpR family regulator